MCTYVLRISDNPTTTTGYVYLPTITKYHFIRNCPPWSADGEIGRIYYSILFYYAVLTDFLCGSLNLYGTVKQDHAFPVRCEQ